MVLEDNIFVERVLPGSVLRGLTEEEMDVYRRPRRPPREPGAGQVPAVLVGSAQASPDSSGSSTPICLPK